jgi:hypothetical protein
MEAVWIRRSQPVAKLLRVPQRVLWSISPSGQRQEGAAQELVDETGPVPASGPTRPSPVHGGPVHSAISMRLVWERRWW